MQMIQGAEMHTPASHCGKEELDSKDGRARRRRRRRDDCRGPNLAPRRESRGRDKHLRAGDDRRTGQSRRNNNSRQGWPYGAAAILDGSAGHVHRCTAVVPGLVYLLQTDSSRRSQCTNQYDGHCRALEDALQHGLSLLWWVDFAVMQITCEPEWI